MKNPHPLDDLDRAILLQLREDPQRPNKSVADSLAVTEATVAARIRAMENDGVMKIMAQQSFSAAGYEVLANVDLCVSGRAVGAVVTGGRSFPSAVPLLGFVAIGVARPDRIRDARGAQPGDAIVLAKPLGTGIYTAALARQKLDAAAYRDLVEGAVQANAAGPALAAIGNVHALAEVSETGLAGRLLAMCRAASLTARIAVHAIPRLPQALALAKGGCIARVSAHNWNRDGAAIRLHDAVMPESRALVTDPQASGGLLVACKPSSADRIVKLLHDAGFAEAAEIGRFGDAPPPGADRIHTAWLEVAS